MQTQTILFPAPGVARIVTTQLAAPQRDEILARTLVSGICMWEIHCFEHQQSPDFLPGHEGIGVVEAVGPDVADVVPGDYITTMGWSRHCLQRRADIIRLSHPPADPALCMLEPLACAINAISLTPLYPGDRVLLSGCGYMGLLLLKLIGGMPLSEIVVTDMKPKNLELAKAFGADRVILASDTAAIAALPSDSFNVAFECSGAVPTLDLCTRVTSRGGTLGLYAWHHGTRTVSTDDWQEKGLTVLNLTPAATHNQRRFRSFAAAEALSSAGKFDQSGLITHRYDFTDIQRAMEESHNREGDLIKSVLVFGD